MIRTRHDRRSFLKGGLVATVALAVGGVTAARLTDGSPAALLDEAANLTPAGQQIMRKVMIAVLDDMLPDEPEARDAALRDAVAELDTTIGALPPHTQKELRDLFGLLSFAPTRLALSGRWGGWQDADTAEVTALMAGLRDSGVSLRRFAYVTLHDLSTLSYYASPQAMLAMGYDGPLITTPLDLD